MSTPKYPATCKFLRTDNMGYAVQNFTLFQIPENDIVYMMTSRYINDKADNVDKIQLALSYYDKGTGKFEKLGSNIDKLAPGHGNSIEVLEYGDSLYCLYVIGNNGSIEGIGCRKLIINEASWGLEEEKRLKLASKIGGKNLFFTTLATSKEYICIANSYGTTVRDDKERYILYDKNGFMKLLTEKNCEQSSDEMHALRVATGSFGDSNSLGLNIPKEYAVLQSMALGDVRSDGNGAYVNIFAVVDDRKPAKGSSETRPGRTEHQINRVKIYLKEKGKEEAQTVQDLSKNDCYYTPVDYLIYNGKSISMNYGTGEPDTRFELEGIKKLSGLDSAKIEDGWYISAFCSERTGKPDDINSNDIEELPWNYMIFSPTTTPIKWN